MQSAGTQRDCIALCGERGFIEMRTEDHVRI